MGTEATPAAAQNNASIDAIIADLASEAMEADAIEAADGEASEEGDGETESEETGEEAEATGEESENFEEESAAPALDLDKVKAAIEKKDLAALLAAIGDEAAEEMLGSKAHKTLRLQLRDADKATAKAAKLTQDLAEKYGDPIAARKAAEGGDVDAFIDLVEKWSGHPWNELQRWVAKGMAGRKERLEAKAKAVEDDAAKQSTDQAKALEETKTWVTSTIKRSDAKLVEQCPDVVDMVIDELRAGLAKGIDSPAKALPLVKAKLKDRFERLQAYFGEKKEKRRTPVVKPSHSAGSRSTRPMTFEEILAETKREVGEK